MPCIDTCAMLKMSCEWVISDQGGGGVKQY
jgi:hypothetical protein